MTEPSMIEGRPPRFADWIAEPMLANKNIYLKVALAAAMINIFALATAMFTMTVYDRVVPNSATDSLIALTIGLAVVIVFDFILRTLRAYFVDIAGARIDRDVGSTVFAKILSIRLDLKKGATGELAGLIRELETMRDFLASATLTAIVDIPFILLILLVIFLIGGPVVLIPLIMVPSVVAVGLVCQAPLDRLARRAMGEGLLKQTVLVETIGGLETVKTSNAGELLTRRWLASIDRHADFSLRQRLVSTVTINAATTAQMISYAGVVVVGVGLIQSQSLSLGGLIACAILSGRCVAPLGQVASLLSRISMTRTAYRQINALMDTPSEGAGINALKLAEAKGKIEFRKVDFRYPNASEKTIENVSFVIQPKEHVALLGRVGSGKSTIAKLMLGLFPPETGLVLLDGTDIRQLEMADMRKLMGSVMQDGALLSGTVRENIMLDRAGIDEVELIRAANVSGTHQFMGRIANGYDVRLADRGEGLSGGQKQSIGLARAIAGRPPIFILDEPTSAMDAQTEAGLIERLEKEFEDRTLVLITHRLPLLRLVGRILLIDEGKVTADGPRDEVLKRIRGVPVSALDRKQGERDAPCPPNVPDGAA